LDYDGYDIGRSTPGHEVSTLEWSPERTSSDCDSPENESVFNSRSILHEEMGDSRSVEYSGELPAASIDGSQWERRDWIGMPFENEVVSYYIYVLFLGCLALMAICIVLMFSVLVETSG